MKAVCIVLLALTPCLLGFDKLPPVAGRSVTTALAPSDGTKLGRVVVPLVDSHRGKCGIHSMMDAQDALAVRIALAEVAERCLDVQYYIWHKDRSGTLLFDALRRAADRGVRVRVLLDDNNTQGLDSTLAALDSHSNIEVRLFNPFVNRNQRALGYINDFRRLNRRMHNKSFTVDNLVTVVGGRNIGDEYFEASDGVAFLDVDVMAVGSIVNDVSNDFDRYWASEPSYPVDQILPSADAALLQELATSAASVQRDLSGESYFHDIYDAVGELFRGTLTFEWAEARMLSDDPDKALGRSKPEATLAAKLKAIAGQPASTLELVSPYFVPTAPTVEWLTGLARRGVKIKVLTNSYEATDVPVVHSGYAKRRPSLLEAGVVIFESRRDPRATRTTEKSGLRGSSTSSLHAKAFSVDRARVFIGSFNFDPRSAKLNTEMGFVIDSPAMAQRMAELFNTRIPENSFEVLTADDGKLYWRARQGTDVLDYKTEPGTTWRQRAYLWMLSCLPIEWLL